MLRWADERSRWPHARHSDFVAADGLRWHVQRRPAAADGPTVLFLHGSGASTHSWAGVIEGLGSEVGWMAVDLPGHGFTADPGGKSRRSEPDATVRGLERLLRAVELRPDVIVGHSAGAAVGLSLSRQVACRAVLALTPSLTDVLRGRVERAVADLVGPVVRSRVVARILAGLARGTGLVDTMLDGTGSDVPEWSRRRYRTLLGDPDHLQAVLRLFTSWSVEAVTKALPGVDAEVVAVVGARDEWVRGDEVRRALITVPRARVVTVEGGHLAHEERPRDALAHLRPLLGRSDG